MRSEQPAGAREDCSELSAEVLVVGGGPAAFATALRLSRHRIPFLLARRASSAPLYGEHLAPEARLLLENLGAGALWDAPAHRPCATFRVAWGSRAFVQLDQLMHPLGCGLALDRAEFDRDLGARVAADSILAFKQLLGVERSGNHWRATFRTEGRTMLGVSARILVDATGRSAACARRIGAKVRRGVPLIALHHRGVSEPPGVDRGDGGALWVASNAAGWGYAVRLADGSAVSAVITIAELALGRAAAREASLRTNLIDLGFPAGLVPAADSSPSRVVPCGPQLLDPSAGESWLAVGDAAYAFDPLTGGGLTRALRSGIDAGDAIARSLNGGDHALRRHAAVETETAARLNRKILRAYRSARIDREAKFWRFNQATDALESVPPRAKVWSGPPSSAVAAAPVDHGQC